MARIGVMALQGGFAKHLEALAEIGHEGVPVKRPRDFAGLEGLVFPGGESTVMLGAIARAGLEGELIALCRKAPVLATCAGLILLAKTVVDPAQHSFGLLDVTVRRNGWGRQVDSFEATDDSGEHGLIFIRAPRVTAVGAEVEILARYEGEPVLVRQGKIWGATFHPELGSDRRIHARIFG